MQMLDDTCLKSKKIELAHGLKWLQRNKLNESMQGIQQCPSNSSLEIFTRNYESNSITNLALSKKDLV